MDHKVIGLLCGALLLLIFASIGLFVIRRQRDYGLDLAVIDTCGARVRIWWLLIGLLIGSFLLGSVVTVLFFALLSFWALREYLTLTPTRPADHKTLFLIVVFCLPLQFILVGLDTDWFESIFAVSTYQVYSILIPIYAFLILPATIAVSGDAKHFLERVAKIQVGVLICVYSLSFAPALLTTPLTDTLSADTVIDNPIGNGIEKQVILPMGKAVAPSEPVLTSKDSTVSTESVPTDQKTSGKSSADSTVQKETSTSSEHSDSVVTSSDSEKSGSADGLAENETVDKKTPNVPLTNQHLCLLFVFVILVQSSDIFQYLWSLVFPQHPVSPAINRTKTWEGVFAGAFSTSFLAVLLWYFTPFKSWWQPAVIGFIVSLMGFAGSITVSAIKRDRGVENSGTLIEGHSGVLDRIDSLCFAAPVFFHLAWMFLNLQLVGLK